jgi:carbamoyl-phosphate synthase large subunit
MGYTLYATSGTHTFLKENGIPSIRVEKLHEHKHPNYADLLREHKIGFSVVLQERFTDTAKTIVEKGVSDGYLMRRMSVDLGLLLFTNAESAHLFVESIHKYKVSDLEILSWNEYKE